MPHVPSVFLSSTLYDLDQVRANIRDFIDDDLGYRCLASETNSFPVDPDAGTIENCRRRVEQDADIFVLIIGGRYGSTPAELMGKSVTNHEYLFARAKGVPIFAFVRAEVLNTLPIWQANPAGDFTGVVNTSRLFEFVREVRDTHSVWVRPFTESRDIIDGLRRQFAYQMAEGLNLRRRLQGSPRNYTSLSGRALRIVLEESNGWTLLLLAQLLEDEIANASDLKLSYEASVSFGRGERVLDDHFRAWRWAVCDQAARLITGLSDLLTKSVAAAISQEDPPRIASCARLVGSAYREAMEWAVDVRRAHVDAACRPVLEAMSLFTHNIVEEVERLPEKLRQIVQWIASDREGDDVPELVFPFSLYNGDQYDQAIEVLRQERPDLGL